MKMNAKLGVTDKKDLLDNLTCFNAGLAVRRLQDAIAFAGFMLEKKSDLKLSKSELQLVSAGIHTAANTAAGHFKSYGPQKESKAKAIASAAKNLNNEVRKYLSPKKPVMTEADGVKIRRSFENLVKKAEDFKVDMADLCILDTAPKTMGSRMPSQPLPILRAALGTPGTPADKAKAETTIDPRKFFLPAFKRPAFHKSIKRRIP